MNRHLALVVGLLSVMVAPRAGARMNEAEFVLANQHSESIRVEFRDKTGKTVAEKTIKPGGEIALHASRRIVVHIGGEAREYALPVSLYLWSSGNRLVPMIGGKWRLFARKTPELGIAFIEGGAVRSVPDFNRSPLTFPLSPRKESETFEQYKRALFSSIATQLREGR